jgi:phosphoribosylglycinamide formyltransferase-1
VKRVGVLVSGRGSNLQALIEAARRGELGGEIAVVVSNVASALGLVRARQAGIAAVFRDHRGKRREAFDAEIVEILRAHHVDIVCLAGFMRLLSPVLVGAFAGRIVNIHPRCCPRSPASMRSGKPGSTGRR